ncbi:hypothetical protein AUJ65_00515 [Candidatus Micrarchaeota archaeon CG1_02_51_15]|nr:MAG: hypothetical protein AUJ65_00515 [Candidatus Micrarchaeota archaeon CG1_02_51_15]
MVLGLIPNFYEKKDYRLLAVIPLILLIASFAIIFVKGIPTGIELRGGLRITVQSAEPVDVDLLRERFSSFSKDLSVRGFENPTGSGIEIEMSNNEALEIASEKLFALEASEKDLISAELNASYFAEQAKNDSSLASQAYAAQQSADAMRAKVYSDAKDLLALIGSSAALPSDVHGAVKLARDEFTAAKGRYREQLLVVVKQVAPNAAVSLREVGSVLSQFFFIKTREFVLYSFILSAIVVLIVFRSLGPSFAVIFGAATDVIVTLGAMSLFAIPLNLATVATLLMLIGFSLDTDMLLTIRVLKRSEDSPAARAFDAFKTGAMMNVTSVVAFGILAIFGMLLQIEVYYTIGLVAVIGSIVDLFATWCANAAIVLWWVERKKN